MKGALGFLLSATVISGGLVATPAVAADFSENPNGTIAVPTTGGCPTLTEAPRPFEVWFNVEDMEVRGFYDPMNHEPWDYVKKIAQIICGAAKGSEIKIGMFFIRAIGTLKQATLNAAPDDPGNTGQMGSRPESDPEVIYDALQYVTKYRGVKVGIVLDGSGITPSSARRLIEQRLGSSGANLTGFPGPAAGGKNSDGSRTWALEWCKNGCFNTNWTSTYKYSINHEKFVAISDTIWDRTGDANTINARGASEAKPALISSSGNFARSQTRNYLQEVTVIYGDRELQRQFSGRYDGMVYCTNTGCARASTKGYGFPSVLRTNFALRGTPTRDRGIWVDRLNPHATDSGRGTYVIFSPQTSTVTDPYIAAFNNVDCSVDKRIRIAMFKLTDAKAESMAKALSGLKRRGCDIKMLLTQQGGATTISKAVIKILKGARIPVQCTATPMHTKVILIGPSTNNSGRIYAGTQNMSTSGLRYSEEHTLIIDSRRASAAYQDDIRRAYGVYMEGWYELSRTAKTCR